MRKWRVSTPAFHREFIASCEHGSMEPGERDADIGDPSHMDGNQQRSWGEYVAGVSGCVVVVGALIYALGLFALWAPIARTHTHDFTTAWHETFLVPRT